MIVTEKVAKHTVCPVRRDGEYLCLGSECMWWRWVMPPKQLLRQLARHHASPPPVFHDGLPEDVPPGSEWEVEPRPFSDGRVRWVLRCPPEQATGHCAGAPIMPKVVQGE